MAERAYNGIASVENELYRIEGISIIMWWKTKCCYCNKPIEVNIPVRLVLRNKYELRGNSCYECVPRGSIIRNGLDECAWEIRNCKK
jgi:hypothetical protein